MKNLLAWASATVVLVFAAAGTAIAAVGAVAPQPPTPEDGTSFNAWVGDQQTYDDNIYRLASTSAVANVISPNAARSDSYNTISVGGLGQLTAGRQLFQVQARVDNSFFIKNTDLNNTAYDATGRWDLSVGPALSGVIGGEVSRQLASFSEVRYNGKDLVKFNDYFFNGRYQLGPHWALLANFDGQSSDHSAQSLIYNNFDAKLYMGGVEYATAADDTFAFKYTYYDGRYPDNAPIGGVFFASDYKEHFPQFWVKYGITDKILFTGNVGHLKRDYVNAVTGSYTGTIWRVRLEYQATEKVSLAARSWHEVHAYTVSAADYFVSTGGSIAPNWQATAKINLSAIFSYEKQQYIQNCSNGTQGIGVCGPREDKINAQQLNVAYTPRDRLIINFFVRHEKRDSTFQGGGGTFPFAYSDELADISLTYKFL